MKICYLTNNLDPSNGWGRYASDLINGVKSRGHEVLILKENDDGFEGKALLKRRFGILSSALKIRPLIKDCDIIHALDIYPFSVIAYLANLFVNRKLIITAQGTYSIAPFYSRKIGWLSKKAAESADMIIAISNYTKKEFLKVASPKNIKVINHGINLENFFIKHVDSEEKYIFGVGALKYRKGYHVSISAFAIARNKIPGLKYKIVGSQSDSNYFNELKKIVRENNLDNEVEFLSNVSSQELRDLYTKASLFVLTSVNHGHHFEGFGLVFLEAAAAGLPTIGTSGNGIEDAIKNNYNGLLVTQNDINKTANAIIEILKNQDKFKEMSINSYKWAEEHDLNKVVNLYIEAYGKK